APNRLGTLNHTLLSIEALRARGVERIKLILMEQQRPDTSARSNAQVLQELISPIEIFSIPYLGERARNVAGLKAAAKNLKKVLAEIGDAASFTALVRVGG